MMLLPTMIYDGMLQPQFPASGANFRHRSEHPEKSTLPGADGQLYRVSFGL
jgi:hypothetical protein